MKSVWDVLVMVMWWWCDCDGFVCCTSKEISDEQTFKLYVFNLICTLHNTTAVQFAIYRYNYPSIFQSNSKCLQSTPTQFWFQQSIARSGLSCVITLWWQHSRSSTVWCNQTGTVFTEMSSWTALTWYTVMKTAFKT